MSDKKAILIGMDLRKPKLHEDIHITNEVGLVNYLIGQKEISEVYTKNAGTQFRCDHRRSGSS